MTSTEQAEQWRREIDRLKAELLAANNRAENNKREAEYFARALMEAKVNWKPTDENTGTPLPPGPSTICDE